MSEISFSGAANSNYFIIVFSVVILCFILVTLWADAITIIYYDMFEFVRGDALHSLLLATIVTLLVMAIVYCIHKSRV